MRSAISVLFALSLIIPSSIDAHACDAGHKDYFGRCIAVTPLPPKLRAFLKDYGQPIGKAGEVADLFAPDLPLFDKPEPGRKIIHTWRRPNANVESEARIEDVLPDFYVVTVSVYEGPTSCGIEEFKQKGPKTLRGYGPEDQPARTALALEVQAYEWTLLAAITASALTRTAYPPATSRSKSR
ncbi:hypothetical protein CT676_26730 [Bradyrhizobium sp. MOS001]|uniref:hypothetical protein n=1 Tax=unclassified Bradyrhizobium TaxID=2631580 RepID=UPI0010756A72|nr:hypothetical protein [Bradyrhizobium sp. MOS001]TFW58013.1 hypothetical protein CT676_26730 [Bradyrhizobium sp. MOS001]